IIAAGAVLLELGTLTWGQSELYREPEDIWQYALNYDPHSWFAAEQVGLCELQAKDADGAEKYEELAYTLTNGNNFLTDANLGYLYITKYNNYPAAISLLEKSVKLNPYQAYNIYSLATFYEKLGEMDKAKTLLDYGMKLMPREPLLHRTMGEYDARIGQIDAAIEEFRTALSYKPDDLDVMYELAFILAKTGHQNDAIDVCQQALGIDPEAANIIQLYKSLMAQNQPEPVLQ
ncbi:MAG TPA: tetratricopeptide repeat protein, partial [Phycisphaerae bacterium]|nr:tetratricopeptide repeat protein [Phycisphaerae bacterium]